MRARDEAVLRRQQAHWMRHDAARWVRPDCARFLIPGTDPADVYPALALKYSPSQPRVPAGNSDGGQWTSGGSGRPRVFIDTTDWGNEAAAPDEAFSSIGADPTGSIDFGDVSAEVGGWNLFGITPAERRPRGVQLAGDLPDGLGGPTEEPPQIPKKMPETVDERMKFVRDAVRWLGRVGRYSPSADVFFGAVDQVEEIKRLTNMIRTANDPPRSLEELRDRATGESEPGYHDHHIVGQHDQNRDQFGDTLIDSYENKARISDP